MHVHRVSRRQRILRQQRLLAEHVQESQHGEREHENHGRRAAPEVPARGIALECDFVLAAPPSGGYVPAMTDVADRLAAALADRYRIERELGHGGMATVHLARDLKHGRTVAIKVLRPELAQAVGGSRFLREINIAAQLQSPHILPLLDSGEAEGLLYYVMPYVEGDSLRGLLATRGALAPSEAMRLLRDVVDGLAHAHRAGVLHRDIKPDNVMIADRHALVVDFGIAKAMSDATKQHDLTSIGFSLGTPAYMAPEQAAADPHIDHRADIYSVGVMAYEMLAGAPPFTGTPQSVMAAHISKAPESLLTVKPDVPPAIAQIVMRCLEKDPGLRFQSAEELLLAIEALSTPGATVAGAPAPAGKRARQLAIAGIGLALVAVAGYVGTATLRRDRWVSETAKPMLARLVEAGDADSAVAVALEIERVSPTSFAIDSLPAFLTRFSVIATVPAGATVCRASFADTTTWRCLGTTPTDSTWLPNRPGLFRYTKPGFRTTYRVQSGRPLLVPLDSVTASHAEMERLAGGDYNTFLVGTDGHEVLKLGEFRLDRFEITNRQYKAFVDGGGYRDSAYWEHPVSDDGKTLTWAQAMARFVDRTGRPGPGTWEGGDFPVGKGEVPVGGVSWYEAAAYAKFAGKSLPTLYHWARAASVNQSRFVVPYSNLEGKEALPVGTLRGVSAGGVSDMAGNVREWCSNETGGGQRYILGGGWSDPTYSFVDAYAQRPMDRSVINGIRLALYAPNEPNLTAASAPISRAVTNYDRETPVADAIFAGYLPQFEYDQSAFNAKVESRDTTPENWNVERVSFDAAYGGERMFAWLFLPKRGKPPYQTVVMFPGSGDIGAGPSTSTPDTRISFVPPSGRVAVIPIYKATRERSDSLRSDIPDKSIFWRDHVVMWVKDYKRTLDYLSTRSEIDTTKFAYFGYSWGGNMGGIIPAVEPRIKASMLYVAGLTMERSRPEVDPFNYLPHVKSPVLMLNGKYDYFFPSASAQEPFFKRLGTPTADKKYILYEGGHDVPRTELIKESLAWLDKYLGPVR
jgi:dienelactone hydrolase